MTAEELKHEILAVVDQLQGCKHVELATAIVQRTGQVPDAGILGHLIDELIEKGELLGLYYVLPDLPYRGKRFLLPANTRWHMEPPHEH